MQTLQSGCHIACPWLPVNIRAGLKHWNLPRSKLLGTPLRSSKLSKIRLRSCQIRTCRSELLQDAPFVAAIGACIVSSLVLQRKGDDTSSNASPDEDDIRNGAITIISFIPLFNWLGWVFAWLDTKDQRYLFYTCAYLAPYVRTGFSFSTDETWLLFLGYFACLAHIQLEVNTSGADAGRTFLQDGLNHFRQTAKLEHQSTQSSKFDESLSPDIEDSGRHKAEDFSQIELSEFDKKLSARKEREVASSSENPVKGRGSEES